MPDIGIVKKCIKCCYRIRSTRRQSYRGWGSGEFMLRKTLAEKNRYRKEKKTRKP